MPSISTNRLLLSEASLSDASFIFRLLNSPNWLQFIGDRGIYSREDAEHYIRHSLMDSYRQNGFGLFKISLRPDLVPIGLCGFIRRTYLDSADIGFAILPEHEGRGFAFEAAEAVMHYGIHELHLHPILAITSKENIKSRNLLKKLGLTEKGQIAAPDTPTEFLLFSNE